MPCFPKDETPEPTATFKWEHHDGEPLKDKRYSVDKKGVLSISRVYPKDSGQFKCAATDPVKGKTIKVLHKVKVVQMPSAGMHLTFTYKVENCNGKKEFMAARHVEKMIKSKFCTKKECKLGTVHGNCHKTKDKKFIRVTVPLSVPEAPTNSCDTICTKKKFKVIERSIKDNISDTVMKGEKLKLPGDAAGIKPSDFDEKTDKMCAPGFELIKDVCIPCLPGHYLDGEKCRPCPPDQYVAKFSATECHHCEDDRVTHKSGSTSDDDCLDRDLTAWSLILVLGVFTTFFCLNVCYWMYWCARKAAGDSACGRAMDAFCQCITCDFKGLSKQERTTVVTFRIPLEVSEDEKPQSDASEASSSTHVSTEDELETTGQAETITPVPPPPPPPPPVGAIDTRRPTMERTSLAPPPPADVINTRRPTAERPSLARPPPPADVINPRRSSVVRTSLALPPQPNPQIVSHFTESQHGRGDDALAPSRYIEKSVGELGNQNIKYLKQQSSRVYKKHSQEFPQRASSSSRKQLKTQTRSSVGQSNMKRDLAKASASLSNLSKYQSKSSTRAIASDNALPR